MQSIIHKLQNEDLTQYKPIPFWSWNAKLEPEELRRQIRWMNENGIGGFFMHARSGLKTEYLSKEWMECIEACAEEAQKLGMDAWAYDENGWPSGFVGGKLLEDPENCDKYILHKIGEFDAEADVSYRMTEQKLIRTADGSKEGEYLNLYIYTSNSTADILNPEVVLKFIDMTHESYKARFGEQFSKMIKGFFTDEPQYQRWNTPYTKMLPVYFRKHYDEDIFEGLGLLFVEKEGYKGFRYRYFKALQQLMLDAFAKMTYEWCNQSGTKITGHYVEENHLSGQLLCCAGIMPFYEYEHIPGIDWLGKGSDNEIAPRQVFSAATQLGKKQILTETFASCGWEITPAHLSRIAGFQFVNGVNLICHHLIPYAEYGNRKHDYPAHYSPVNPWVREAFLDFNNYFTRLGYMLANSTEPVNVAVLHPIRSASFEYKRIGNGEAFDVIEKGLRTTVRKLSSAGIGYHFLDETLLKKYGFVKEGKIGCGRCDYEYLILPHLYTMDKTTEQLIHAFAMQGGKILIDGLKPEYLEWEAFEYSYLESNCNLDEIREAQPFQVFSNDTQIYTTYREYEDNTFLFAQNASATDAQAQTFDLGDEVKSFMRLDLTTYKTKRVPLTITLKVGEGAILFPDKEVPEEEEELIPYTLQFEHAKVDYEENHMPVDFVSYSKDGVNYSKIIPCAAMFQQLLEERYEGRIFFRYTFDVRVLPNKMLLRGEECNANAVYLNDQILKNKQPSGIEKNLYAYDITEFVKLGINTFTVEINWHQEEAVYYALFGENVSESLRNCIVYDSEVAPIYLAGEFGVYTDQAYGLDEDPYVLHGDGFYIGESAKIVSEPVTDGFPFVSGAITLTQNMVFDTDKVLLQVAGNYLTATVWANGHEVGKLLFAKELDISAFAKTGENEISVRFNLSNFNLMGPQHHVNNKNGIGPNKFELPGQWKDGKSEFFHDYYDLKCLYKR